MSSFNRVCRRLARNRTYSGLVVLTLAIVIGVTTAVLSVIQTTIINPLPVGNPDRLLYVTTFGSYQPEFHKIATGVNPLTLAALRDNRQLFSEFSVRSSVNMTYRNGWFSEELKGYRVSPGFLSMWQTPPQLGRLFHSDDVLEDDGSRVVLSHRFWTQSLEGREGVLGETILLRDRSSDASHKPHLIVGVMPAHFSYPDESTDFWIAAAGPSVSSEVEWGRYSDRKYWVTLRLGPGVEERKVQALLDSIQARQIEEFAKPNEGWALQLRRATDLFVDEKIQSSLWVLAALCGIVWLIACANLASLTGARVESRQQEFAIRGALGAQRWQVIGQTFSECLLLAIVGGAVGLLVTDWGMNTLDTFMGGVRLRPLEIDRSVLMLSLATGVVTALVFGLLPACLFSEFGSMKALKVAGARVSSTRGTRLVSRALVLSQVTLTVVVLTAAGLMLRSVLNVLAVDPGFQPDRLFTVDADLPLRKYFRLDNPEAEISSVVERLHQNIISIPGVASVGTLVSQRGSWEYVAVGQEHRRLEITLDGCGVDDMNPFRVLGTPLLAGRFLDGADRGLNTVVVNRTLAEGFWQEAQSALGKKFRGAPDGQYYDRVWQVVGVVEDIKTRAYDEAVFPTLYQPVEAYYHRGSPRLWVRSAVEPAALHRSVYEAIQRVEPESGKSIVTPIKTELYQQTESRRTYAFYLMLLTAVCIFLAAIGIYGLMSNAAARRMREMGIRIALGASRASVSRGFVIEGFYLALGGGVLGLVCAISTGGYLRNQLFGITPSDPLTLIGALLVLVLIGIFSALIPARRASQCDPVQLLREE